MARYGVPYEGSKNSIAKWVVETLPPGERLVDLFAGGCAVTHCAMLSGKWEEFLVNDINNTPQLFLDAIHGKLRDRTEWISREWFFLLKDSDPFVRQCWSFGNGGNSYLYSRDLEAYKEAVHMELTAQTLHERYIWHRKAVREGVELVNKLSLQSLQSLESLQRLQSLERLESLHSLESLQSDYRDVPLRDGDIVYCDIPYRGTGAEYVTGFDHEAFYAWCVTQTVPVYISEYEMPNDRFEIVAETERCGHLSSTNNANRKTERIYRVRK